MHQFLENVRVAARTACPPWRGNPSLGGCLHRSEVAKIPLRAFGARSSCSIHSARPPNHVGDPRLTHRPHFSDVLAGYHPTATTSGPSTATTRAPSVSGVIGWVLAPRRASRRVRARTGSICVRVVLRRVAPCAAPEPLGAPRSPGTCPLCMPGGGGRSARRVATTHAHEDPTSRMERPREAPRCITARSPRCATG